LYSYRFHFQDAVGCPIWLPLDWLLLPSGKNSKAKMHPEGGPRKINMRSTYYSPRRHVVFGNCLLSFFANLARARHSRARRRSSPSIDQSRQISNINNDISRNFGFFVLCSSVMATKMQISSAFKRGPFFHPEGMESTSPALTRPCRGYAG
jgi:hypothetical protein